MSAEMEIAVTYTVVGFAPEPQVQIYLGGYKRSGKVHSFSNLSSARNRRSRLANLDRKGIVFRILETLICADSYVLTQWVA